MVDNTNPTNQFHPYQGSDATPQTGTSTSGLGSILSKVGIDPNRVSDAMRNVDVKGSLGKARGMVNSKNGGMVLGGLAALAIGAGMLRNRRSMG